MIIAIKKKKKKKNCAYVTRTTMLWFHVIATEVEHLTIVCISRNIIELTINNLR